MEGGRQEQGPDQCSEKQHRLGCDGTHLGASGASSQDAAGRSGARNGLPNPAGRPCSLLMVLQGGCPSWLTSPRGWGLSSLVYPISGMSSSLTWG